MKRRTCKASTVVEMAYLMPVVLLCWMLVVFALFFYHDKSVIAGAAYESAVMGTELWAEETGYRSAKIEDYFREIIYVFLNIFLYLLKCPQSLILSALRAFCFCGKPHISRSIFLYFRYQAWLKSW